MAVIQSTVKAVLRPPYLLVRRFFFALGYFRKPVRDLFRWLFQSREFTNLTYDLTPRNLNYLAAFVAEVSGKPLAEIHRYISELMTDDELHQHLSHLAQAAHDRYGIDSHIKYGRRIGWYAFVRAMKPKVVIETGIDKGLGSCVLAAAARRNIAEGSTCKIYVTDINPNAGYFIKEPYKQYVNILIGDSIESLQKLAVEIDLFINDSDHSAEYESKEYEIIRNKLSSKALIIGDNSHTTDSLWNFAHASRRKFLFFKEEPRDHWYQGGGIGASW